MWLFNPKDETIVLVPNHQVDSYIKEKGTKFFKFNFKPTFGELEEARRKYLQSF